MRWNALLWSVSLSFAIVTVGCAGGHFTPLREPPHPLVARAPEQVEIFATGIARPHVDVGFIDAYGLHFPDGAVEALRKLAAEYGCDALFMMWPQRGVCVQFTAPAAPPVAPTCLSPPPPPAITPPPSPPAAPSTR